MEVADLLLRLLAKDPLTYEHSIRVGALAKTMISHYVPGMDEMEKQSIIAGCTVHDIGKIMIPDDILCNPSPLTPSEWQIMKRHPEIGARLLLIEGERDPYILDIVKYHHERWDGAGYPYGLKGNEIPPVSRMCSILDAFDSMISDRPYRKGMSVEEAKQELCKQSWSQFDGFYVNQFINLPNEVLLSCKRTP
ncbi:HD-GYP domain-containing protein [Paenibacillus hamazuiensis]|uniref:HD-GYP domain-containing protein n=1 Tax=Paenibacillus hamazuiensis TaxID=2936508 RepID=UPI00200F3BD7|nr:HD domain-containing phosphohydrolase [Paenibacillus hamazuiensis]